MNAANQRGKRRFRPQFEALEDRTVPSVSAPVCLAPGVVFFGATSTGSNTLNLFDNGSGGITFNTGKTTDPMKSLPASCGPVIHEIIYNASSASDTVTYNMVKNATLTENIDLIVVLPPTAGNKGLSLTVGTATKPIVPGTPGTPPTPEVPGVPVNISGHLGIRVEGSDFFDNVTFTYAGQLLGGHLDASYVARVRKGPNHEHLSADKVSFTFNMLPNSRGTLKPKVKGGAGDDALTLFVFGTAKSPKLRVPGAPQLDGGPGLNSGNSVLPIREVNIQS